MPINPILSIPPCPAGPTPCPVRPHPSPIFSEKLHSSFSFGREKNGRKEVVGSGLRSPARVQRCGQPAALQRGTGPTASHPASRTAKTEELGRKQQNAKRARTRSRVSPFFFFCCPHVFPFCPCHPRLARFALPSPWLLLCCPCYHKYPRRGQPVPVILLSRSTLSLPSRPEPEHPRVPSEGDLLPTHSSRGQRSRSPAVAEPIDGEGAVLREGGAQAGCVEPRGGPAAGGLHPEARPPQLARAAPAGRAAPLRQELPPALDQLPPPGHQARQLLRRRGGPHRPPPPRARQQVVRDRGAAAGAHRQRDQERVAHPHQEAPGRRRGGQRRSRRPAEAAEGAQEQARRHRQEGHRLHRFGQQRAAAVHDGVAGSVEQREQRRDDVLDGDRVHRGGVVGRQRGHHQREPAARRSQGGGGDGDGELQLGRVPAHRRELLVLAGRGGHGPRRHGRGAGPRGPAVLVHEGRGHGVLAQDAAGGRRHEGLERLVTTAIAESIELS